MLVMELHFFERLTVTNPPFVSEQELHFGCCVQEVPLQRRRAIIPVCSWALLIVSANRLIYIKSLNDFRDFFYSLNNAVSSNRLIVI